ncbi:hypothetical protein LTR84_004679 [Exophiala bonariae]|uniref:Uncharacterized protein n=1 Tax=Exophiala bonariae TaxID=1690606 RepID=A0AAV9NMK2_9EURO|nr:hypothetical protein LTR84_004679 [Exophiala bonariae]
MAISPDLPGVALITGAASGIGRAAAIAFAEAGCTQMALLDLNETGLQESKELVTQTISATTPAKTPNVSTFTIDVTSTETVTAVFGAVRTHFPRVDYSVQCAGIITFGGASATCPIDDFDRQNAVNYRGLWLCSREAIKIMHDQELDSDAYPDAKISPLRAQRGAIVNISSGLANYSQAGSPAYCGAKAGVLALTRSDAIDYVGQRIRVNAVLPGIVDTPITNPSPEIRKWLEENSVQRTPFKRMGTAEEIADVIVFLASNKSSFVTGASWSVDGGFGAGY